MWRTTAALLLTAGAAAGGPDPRSRQDWFGRPQPHGDPVRGGFVGLYAGRASLAFGQPVEAELFTVSPTDEGPCVHARVGDGGDVRLSAIDGHGRQVGYRLESAGCGGGLAWGACPFRLWPAGPHARGLH